METSRFKTNSKMCDSIAHLFVLPNVKASSIYVTKIYIFDIISLDTIKKSGYNNS